MSFHTQSSALNGDTPQSVTVMIFGASGDLTSRKLIPALYSLFRNGFLDEKTLILGVARRPKTHEEFREEMRMAIVGDGHPEEWTKFAPLLHYVQTDLQRADDFQGLRTTVEALEQSRGLSGERVVYLATDPALFLPSIENLHAAGMVPHDAQKLRVVVEKPFGFDLQSARELSRQYAALLTEEQIYRIDHYLGKETVQNILLFRFGNAIFEPLLHRHHVDHVQITVAETQGMEGGRGAYYDKAGALRDVLQNHVLQLLCLVAMETPARFEAEYIRDEKLKVLQSLSSLSQLGDVENWAVAGQYAASSINGVAAKAYINEDRVPGDSRTETFVAVEARINNWRWEGVPFYLRTGKRLPQRVTEIAIQFKLPPLNLFQTVHCDDQMCHPVKAQPNMLIFRIQPHESITLRFGTKRPGMQYQIETKSMDFSFDAGFAMQLPEAYERLLLDVIRRDSTLFTRSDELEAAWSFVQPILDHWSRPEHSPELYPAGSWGPKAAHTLLTRSGRVWRIPRRETP